MALQRSPGSRDRSHHRRILKLIGILPCAEEWDSVLAAAQTHHANGSLFTPHRRRRAPEMLHVGAAEHDVDMGPGLTEEDGDVVDEDPDEEQLADARTQGRATTPVRRRQSTPNHCRHPLRRLIQCRCSHASRRCASSMARVRPSRGPHCQRDFIVLCSSHVGGRKVLWRR